MKKLFPNTSIIPWVFNAIVWTIAALMVAYIYGPRWLLLLDTLTAVASWTMCIAMWRNVL